MIGPFPPPIQSGQAQVNQILLDGLRLKNECAVINTKTENKLMNLDSQGKVTKERLFSSLWKVFLGSLRIVFGKKNDVVYLTTGQTFLGYSKYIAFMLAARIRRTNYFIHIHGANFGNMFDSLGEFKKKIIKMSLKKVAGVIVSGESLKAMFRGLVRDSSIHVCDNAIPDSWFAAEEEIDAKQQANSCKQTLNVVYLGNAMESKGILDLLEAISIMRDKDGIDIHLDIITSGIEPKIEKEFNKRTSNLGSLVTIHRSAPDDRKKKILLANRIFCLPTKHPFGEGQPISIIEGMAAGCTIVTTKVGGIEDMLVGMRYVSFAEKDNPKSIADCILSLFHSDSVDSKAVWEYARERYSIGRFVNRITEIFLTMELAPEKGVLDSGKKRVSVR